MALAAGAGAGLATVESAVDPHADAAAAATTFMNDYPDGDASDCSGQFGADSWCKDTNSNHVFEASEMNSSRGYGYRNCTDGAAYWVGKYTGVALPHNWGNAEHWETAAASNPAYTVYDGSTNSIEPGDIAQSDDGAVGHVGFVTSVTKNIDGTVASFTTAEMNKTDDGTYSTNTYNTRNSAGKFVRFASPARDWDHFIDLNGPGVGLNNENWPATPDADSDGVADSQDQCPLVPGIATNNGCPANKPNMAADINGDGKMDLLHIWSGGVNSWIDNGNGTFTVHSPYKPSPSYDMLSGIDWKTGDVNHDGRTDLMHLWSGGVNTWVSNGDGTFSVSNTYIPSGYNMNGGFDWEVADANGDGKSDLLHLWSGGVNTWISNGNGTYSVSPTYRPTGYNMTSGIGWKTGDFNGDGKTDLLHLWSGGVNLWASLGNGTYIVTNPYRPANYTMAGGIDWKTGDFNGDGKMDLAHIWDGGVNLWKSNGDGSFTVSGPYKPAGYNMNGGIDFKIADVNGDGKSDLMHLWSGGLNAWISNGDGTFAVKNPYLPSPGYNMSSGIEFTAGDTNADGKADMLHLWNGGVNTWKSNGDGTYTVSGPYLPSSGYDMTGGKFLPAY